MSNPPRPGDFGLTVAPEGPGHLSALAAAMVLWRTGETPVPAAERRNSNLLAATCRCARTIRAAASTLAEADILCTACGQPFTPKNADA